MEQRQRHVSADNRGCLEEMFFLRCEPVDAGCQHCLDSIRHGHGQAAVTLLHNGPRQLLQKERIPIRFCQNLLHHRIGNFLSLQDRLHHPQAVTGRQARQGQLRGIGFVQPGGAVPRSCG